MRSTLSETGSHGLVTVELRQGETLRAEPGSMVAMRSVSMKSGRGGFFSGFVRKLSGESFFLNDFTAEGPDAMVCLAPKYPGTVAEHFLRPAEGVLVQGGGFLASFGEDVETDSDYQGMRSMFSGESAFFLRVSAGEFPATAWFSAFGALSSFDVNDADFTVDTGHLVAFTDGLSYSVSRVPGLGNLLLGGEALVLRLAGTGRVWVQACDFEGFAAMVHAEAGRG